MGRNLWVLLQPLVNRRQQTNALIGRNAAGWAPTRTQLGSVLALLLNVTLPNDERRLSPYSSRRATIGSIRAARRAGIYPAIAAVAIRKPALANNVFGSPGAIP